MLLPVDSECVHRSELALSIIIHIDTCLYFRIHRHDWAIPTHRMWISTPSDLENSAVIVGNTCLQEILVVHKKSRIRVITGRCNREGESCV